MAYSILLYLWFMNPPWFLSQLQNYFIKMYNICHECHVTDIWSASVTICRWPCGFFRASALNLVLHAWVQIPSSLIFFYRFLKERQYSVRFFILSQTIRNILFRNFAKLLRRISTKKLAQIILFLKNTNKAAVLLHYFNY